VSIASVRIAGRRRSFPTGLRSRSDVGATPRAIKFQVTRTSPSRTKARACAKPGDLVFAPDARSRKNPVAAGGVSASAGEHRPSASKTAHNRSGPSHFPGLAVLPSTSFCRLAAVKRGSDRRRSAGKGSFGGPEFQSLWRAFQGRWRNSMARRRLFTDSMGEPAGSAYRRTRDRSALHAKPP